MQSRGAAVLWRPRFGKGKEEKKRSENHVRVLECGGRFGVSCMHAMHACMILRLTRTRSGQIRILFGERVLPCMTELGVHIFVLSCRGVDRRSKLGYRVLPVEIST